MSFDISIQPLGSSAKWFCLDEMNLFKNGIYYPGSVYLAFESPHTQPEKASIEILKLYMAFKTKTQTRLLHQAMMALCKSMRSHQVHNIKLVPGMSFPF